MGVLDCGRARASGHIALDERIRVEKLGARALAGAALGHGVERGVGRHDEFERLGYATSSHRLN
jgi:hypothetical protein